MHNLKDIRKNPERYQQGLITRGDDPNVIPAILVLDEIVRSGKQIQQERRTRLKALAEEFRLGGDKTVLALERYIVELDTLIAYSQLQLSNPLSEGVSEMSDEHYHELAILTNDGWVVALKSNKQIDLGEVIVSSIIVQPVEEYAKRVEGEPNELRREYRLTRAGQVDREPWTSGTGTPVNRVATVTE